MSSSWRWFLLFATSYSNLVERALADAVTFNIGAVVPYTDTMQPTPKPTGSTILYTPVEQNASIGLFFSPDVQDALAKTTDEKCTTFDTACFQAVQDTVRASNPELQPRNLEWLLWFVEAVAWPGIDVGELQGFIGIFFPFLYKYREDGKQKVVTIVLPKPVVSQVASIANATEIVVEDSSGPIATITPTFQPTATPVTAYPGSASMTILPQSKDGNKQGDLDVVLPEDLAARIQEFLKITLTDSCSDAASFHPQISRFRPRQQPDSNFYEQLLCATEQLGTNARADGGGPFAGINAAVTRQTQLLWLDPNIQAIQLIAQNRARNNAPALRVVVDPVYISATVGMALAVAFSFLMAATLAAHNIISQSQVTVMPFLKADESCAATTAPECGAGDCKLKNPFLIMDNFICIDGQFKGCECALNLYESYDVDENELAILLSLGMPGPASDDTWKPSCYNSDTDQQNVFLTGEDVLDAIGRLCAGPSEPISPKYGDGNGQILIDAFHYNADGKFCFQVSDATKHCDDSNHAVMLSGQFADDQTGCSKPTRFNSPTGDMCKDIFTKLLSDCSGGFNETWGGNVIQKTDHGCVRWAVWGA